MSKDFFRQHSSGSKSNHSHTGFSNFHTSNSNASSTSTPRFSSNSCTPYPDLGADKTSPFVGIGSSYGPILPSQYHSTWTPSSVGGSNTSRHSNIGEDMIDLTHDEDDEQHSFDFAEPRPVDPFNSFIFDESEQTPLPGSSRKKSHGKSVTFHDEDIFNIYDNNYSSIDGSYDDCEAFQDDLGSSKNLYNQSSCAMSSSKNVLNVASEHQFTQPLPVSSHPNTASLKLRQGIVSACQLDAETSAKLLSFSQRLKSLKSPATPFTPTGRSTPRPSVGMGGMASGMVTPRPATPRPTTPLRTPDTGAASVVSSSRHASHRPEPSCFAAVFEGTGSAAGEVGVAAITLTSPALIICQFSDTKTYPRTITKLLTINPSMILVPDTSKAKLYDDIADKLPLAKVIRVHRRYFNDSKGHQTIKHLLVPDYASVELQFHNKYYCLAAANALLKYIEQVENFYIARKSLKVDYQVAEKSTVIDPATAEHIELLTSLGPRKSKNSLFGLLNKCSSNTGVRLLRSNLYQPPIDQTVINERLELVEEMVKDTGFFNALKNIISRFPDLDPVLNLCVKKTEMNISSQQIEMKLNNMISLKQILQLLPQFIDILSNSKSKIAVEATKRLQVHANSSSLLLEMMHLVLMENINVGKGGPVRFSRAMAVKSEVNGLLDIARSTFCEYVEQLEFYVQDLAQVHSLPLKLHWNNNKGKGFCIQINNNKNCRVDDKNLPAEFIRIVKSKYGVSFVTQAFAIKDALAKSSLDEISKMSNSVLNELLNEVREYIGFLYMLGETIAHLDMLISLATVTIAEEYVKPEFGDSLVIRGGRHPVLEQVSLNVTPNDVNVDELSRLQILTGPNMSGKSTYLRQVVLLTIMAQIGCFVPAQFASFRIPDRIFSRVSNRDCIETNSSTFMVEMQETAFILSNLGPTSLVIIDELGRGTSVDEGTAICWAVCEALLQSTSFVFLATHFHQMKSLAQIQQCVENHQFLTRIESGKVVNTHQLVRCDDPSIDINESDSVNYGLELASNSSLPAEIVEKAKQLSKKFTNNQSNLSIKTNKLDQICVDYAIKLKRLAKMGLSMDELKAELKTLKSNFLQESKEIPEVTGNKDDIEEKGDDPGSTSGSVNAPAMEEAQLEASGSGKSIFYVPELDSEVQGMGETDISSK